MKPKRLGDLWDRLPMGFKNFALWVVRRQGYPNLPMAHLPFITIKKFEKALVKHHAQGDTTFMSAVTAIAAFTEMREATLRKQQECDDVCN